LWLLAFYHFFRYDRSELANHFCQRLIIHCIRKAYVRRKHAERMQVPLDYPAVVAVLCLSGVTNRRATIQPKAADTSWVVVPNLWGGIIAQPGLMKSPVMPLHNH
jgi:hypothetical protein